MSQPRDSIKVGRYSFDLGHLAQIVEIRAFVNVRRTQWVRGCERCKSVCVLGAHDCTCCVSVIKSRVYPDDGKHHVRLLSGDEFLLRADSFMERMAA